MSLGIGNLRDVSIGGLDMQQRGELNMVDLQQPAPAGGRRLSKAKAVLGAAGLFLVGLWIVSGETGAYDSLIAGHGVTLSALSWPSGFGPVLRLLLGTAIALVGAVGVAASLLFGTPAGARLDALGK